MTSSLYVDLGRGLAMDPFFLFNLQRYHGTVSEYPGWDGRCFGAAFFFFCFSGFGPFWHKY
jgi:hypothetical protein